MRLINTTYFICIYKNSTCACDHLKSSNLSADSFKKTLELSGPIPEPAILSGDIGQQIHYFEGCQLIKTWMYNIRLQAPKLARKYEIKHWCACGADGRKVEWSVSGPVIGKFSRMNRFSKLWGFELSPWSNKISAQNFKHYVTSIDRKMSPRSTQVMMVSVYSSLTAVN